MAHDVKLELITSETVKPLLKRYLSAIHDSNPDKAAVRQLKELLNDRPLISRYEFLRNVASTLNEDIRRRVRIKNTNSK